MGGAGRAAGGLHGSDPRPPVNLRFKSLKAELGCPGLASVERFFAACPPVIPRPLRWGAALLGADGARAS